MIKLLIYYIQTETVNYYGKIITQTESNRYLDLLLKNIPWKNDEALVYGKHITTKEKLLGMAIWNIHIHIQIQQRERYHELMSC